MSKKMKKKKNKVILWHCEYCSCLNDDTLKKCEHCGASRPIISIVKETIKENKEKPIEEKNEEKLDIKNKNLEIIEDFRLLSWFHFDNVTIQYFVLLGLLILGFVLLLSTSGRLSENIEQMFTLFT